MDEITKKIKILVVEDHPIAQKIAKMILASLNCDCDIIENGTYALKLFSENHYDLIFMDLGLPDKGGFTIASEIRKMEQENNRTVPPTSIIGLSVHDGERAKAHAIKSGMNDYLVKPLTIDVCQNILKRFVPSMQL